jgi:hypothetical protein
MGLSDFHPRPARVLTDRRLRQLSPTHGEGSPVLTREPFYTHVDVTTPAAWPGARVACFPDQRPPSPVWRGLGARISSFSRPARRSLMFRPARSLIPSKGPFTPEASTRAVTVPSRSGCFRLEQQLPGGIPSSHWILAPFSRRTPNSSLAGQLKLERERRAPDQVSDEHVTAVAAAAVESRKGGPSGMQNPGT